MRLPTHIAGLAVHPHVTVERIVDAAHRRLYSLDDPGFCLACGEENDGCEGDARGYVCHYCDAPAVYGAEELLQYIV